MAKHVRKPKKAKHVMTLTVEDYRVGILKALQYEMAGSVEDFRDYTPGSEGVTWEWLIDGKTIEDDPEKD